MILMFFDQKWGAKTLEESISDRHDRSQVKRMKINDECVRQLKKAFCQ